MYFTVHRLLGAALGLGLFDFCARGQCVGGARRMRMPRLQYPAHDLVVLANLAPLALDRPPCAGVVCHVDGGGRGIAAGASSVHGVDLLGHRCHQAPHQDRRRCQGRVRSLARLPLVRTWGCPASCDACARPTGSSTGACAASHPCCAHHCARWRAAAAPRSTAALLIAIGFIASGTGK